MVSLLCLEKEGKRLTKGFVKWFDTKKGYGFIEQPGGRHSFMKKDVLKVSIPSPHKEDVIGAPLLKEILRQAGISQEDWDNV